MRVASSAITLRTLKSPRAAKVMIRSTRSGKRRNRGNAPITSSRSMPSQPTIAASLAHRSIAVLGPHLVHIPSRNAKVKRHLIAPRLADFTIVALNPLAGAPQ